MSPEEAPKQPAGVPGHSQAVDAADVAAAVTAVWNLMLDGSVVCGDANEAEAEADSETAGQIVGSIAFAGDLRGVVEIRLAEPVAAAITAALTGEPIASASALAVDAIGELLNLIAGQLKAGLDLAGARLGTPCVDRFDALPPDAAPPVLFASPGDGPAPPPGRMACRSPLGALEVAYDIRRAA